MTDLWLYIFAAAVVMFALATYTALQPQMYRRRHGAKVYSVTEARATERRVRMADPMIVAGVWSYLVPGCGFSWKPCRRKATRRGN